MNRRIATTLLGALLVAGALGAAPATGPTAPGLRCAITRVWKQGTGHGGLPKYGVAVRLTNARATGTNMRAALTTGTGKTLLTRLLFVAAHTARSTSVTADSSTVSVSDCRTT
jgi:hypothetical protein